MIHIEFENLGSQEDTILKQIEEMKIKTFQVNDTLKRLFSEAGMILVDFKANSLCKLHRELGEITKNGRFFNFHHLYLRAQMNFFIQINLFPNRYLRFLLVSLIIFDLDL